VDFKPERLNYDSPGRSPGDDGNKSKPLGLKGRATRNPTMKLRWYQYSLRTLLIIVTIIAIFMSWFSVKLKQAREQKAVVEEITKLEMGVQYDWQLDRPVEPPKPGQLFGGPKRPWPDWLRNILGNDFFDNVVVVFFRQNAVAEKNLIYLKKFPRLRYIDFLPEKITDVGLANLSGTSIQSLNLTGSKITDAGLTHLEHLPQLQWLYIDNTAITDEGFEHLKNLTQLRAIFLKNDKITDAGLRHLKRLHRLERLFLDNTQITDAGLENLANLSNLQILYLNQTAVGDAGLAHLKELTKLYSLQLNQTAVTDAGLKYLKDLTELKDLELQNTKITDKGLAYLKDLSKLEILSLRETRITDAGLDLLKALTNLKALNLVRTETSPEKVIELIKVLKISEISHYDKSGRPTIYNGRVSD
jgi:Leucine-rich repeat (LRR) protein